VTTRVVFFIKRTLSLKNAEYRGAAGVRCPLGDRLLDREKRILVSPDSRSIVVRKLWRLPKVMVQHLGSVADILSSDSP
jgi:hypothetical protein